MPDAIRDLIIIGAGPAGYTAGIYARRYQIDTLLIGTLPGGQITEAHKVCNFPGYPEITGMELGQLMHKHSESLGAEEIMDSVMSVTKSGDYFTVTTNNSGDFISRSILIAHGTKRRKLNLPSEKKFLDRGVSYCATCDGAFYSNKTVGVVGGSNAATTSALLLSDLAKKVYLIYRGEKLKGDQMWIDQLYKKENVEIVLRRNVVELIGDDNLSAVGLDEEFKGMKKIDVDGLFVEIGSIPNTTIVERLNVKTNEKGFIHVESDQSTNVLGVYAAGDITDGSDEFRQVITACSEGAVAANSVYRFLNK